MVTGRKSGGSCTGATVTVNRSGLATVTVPALGAVAVKRSDRVSR